NLNAMTVAELLQLRDEIKTALSGKIDMERRELQSKIDELARLEAGSETIAKKSPAVRRRPRRVRGRGNGRGRRQRHPLAGKKIEPKYRDPDNPAQTWAGRGQTPRWLRAYEAAGRKREEFLVESTPGAEKASNRRRKSTRR